MQLSFQYTVSVVDPASTDPNLITNTVKVVFGRSPFDTDSYYVDDVNLSLAVPEPSILCLFSLAPALAMRRRRA